MSRFWSGFRTIDGSTGATETAAFPTPALQSAVMPVLASGSPVDAGAIATGGTGALALSLVKVAPFASATTGAGVTAVALRRIGVLSDATSGAGTSSASLRKIGVLTPASSGRSNLAMVLSDVGALTVLTSGRSIMAASLIAIRVLTPATAGTSAAQATLASVRSLAMATNGVSTLNVSIGGGHGLLTVATTGASDDALALINGAMVEAPSSVGRGASGSSGRRARLTAAPLPAQAPTRVLLFPVATAGTSTLEVQLSTQREAVPPAASTRVLAAVRGRRPEIVRELAADPLDEWATLILLLEAA